MKKYLLIILLVCFNLNYAQLFDDMGLKFGLVYSNVDHSIINLDLNYDTKYKPGFAISFYGDIELTRSIDVQTEFGYFQKGFSEDIISTDSKGNPLPTITNDNTINYIVLQVTPKYTFNTLVEPYVFAGPRVDFLLSSDFESVFTAIEDNIKKTQVGAVGGIGLSLEELIDYALFIEGSVHYDFSDYIDTRNLSGKNTSFVFKIGMEI